MKNLEDLSLSVLCMDTILFEDLNDIPGEKYLTDILQRINIFVTVEGSSQPSWFPGAASPTKPFCDLSIIPILFQSRRMATSLAPGSMG